VIELLSEQPHGILEAAREGGPMTRPGNLFGPDHAALRAAEPADRPLYDGCTSPDRQVPPPACRFLETAPNLGAAFRAGQHLEAAANVDHQRFILEAHALYPEAWQLEQLVQ